MRQISLLVLLALGASLLIAQEGPPKEAPPTGFLFNSLGGERITKATGIKVDYYFQEGLSTNNVTQRGTNGAPTGNSNGAVLTPADANVPTLDQFEQYIHKDIKGNMIIGVTPTPAPMYKKFDLGFMADAVYGRQAQACRMTGFDMNWSMNPAMGTADNTARYMWLCVPNAYVDMYIPVLKGVAIRLGRQGDNMMTDEIPPNAFGGPNFFYSHSYGFYRTSQVFGGRISANLFRSREHGLLMGELIVHNGLGTMYSMSKKFNYSYALRYRTPKMDTWIDYTGRVGYGNVKTDAKTGKIPEPQAIWVTDNTSKYHLYSPNSQLMFENALSVSKVFTPHWRATALVQFGKQFSDGASTTWAARTPAGLRGPLTQGFKGASFLSYEGKAIYTFNKKVSSAIRLEQFRIPNGYFFPIAQFGEKGGFNDLTWGVNYKATKYVNLRPEIRYDWQFGNYLKPAFGTTNPNGKTAHSQVTAGIDAVFFF